MKSYYALLGLPSYDGAGNRRGHESETLQRLAREEHSINSGVSPQNPSALTRFCEKVLTWTKALFRPQQPEGSATVRNHHHFPPRHDSQVTSYQPPAILRCRRIVENKPVSPPVRRHAVTIHSPKEPTLAEERGWSKRAGIWYGTYKHGADTYEGQAERHRLGYYICFIRNPHAKFKEHTCLFKDQGREEWYWLHHKTGKYARNLSEGISGMEYWLEQSKYTNHH